MSFRDVTEQNLVDKASIRSLTDTFRDDRHYVIQSEAKNLYFYPAMKLSKYYLIQLLFSKTQKIMKTYSSNYKNNTN